MAATPSRMLALGTPAPAFSLPDIEGRLYPPELAGELYPGGIPIRAEEELVDLIRQHNVEQVVFAYSDVPHEYVMHKAAMVTAAAEGALFAACVVGAMMVARRSLAERA